MGTFSRPRESQPVDRMGRIQTMMDMPFTLQENLGQQMRQGALDSFGLGTVLRQAQIPQGNTAPDMGGVLPNPVASLGRLAQNVGGMLRGDQAQPSLTEDEYKASAYFRTEIPFQEGMTQDRAAALALFYDTKKTREYFGSKRPISTFIGQFAGQAFDPINYVPVFGQATEAAAVARFGTIGGRALVGAGDAAINTAAFGALTAGLRDQFGDDTSWQAMTSEIAMSALIGGVFGGVSPLIRGAYNRATGRTDRAAEAKVADRLADLRAVKESRAALNEAVGDMVAGRDVVPSPNTMAVVDRITSAVTAEGTAARALADQTANVTGDAVAITPSGARVNVRPEVVDASSLVRASGDLQVRNRSSQASAAQVEDIAINLDPMRLMPSIDADSGAPIVGDDGIVDSGNGRVMAINRAYEAYPARAAAYKQALVDAGYDVTGIDRPVLINRRTTELSRDARAKFNAEANAPRAAQMSAVELAAMDRNALEGTLDVFDPSPITSAGNRPFVQRFLGNLSQSARGALIDANGNLNADGARRIENALVAAAYGDVDLAVVRRFAEATDDNTRAIVGAMSDVAGRWGLMRQEVKLGNISPEFDVTEELTQALRMIGQWREQAAREKRPVGVVIKEGMGQLDLLDGEVSPETQVIISAFYRTNSFSQAAGRETIAEFLGKVADAAAELGRPQLFETADVGKLELLRNVAVNEQGNLFTPVGAVDGIEADGGFSRGVEVAADRQGGGQGTVGSGRVAVEFADRLTAAGRSPEEATALGEIVDAFYVQQASRLGLSMDEMIERFGLPEVRQGGDVPQAALAQSPDSPAFREWFGESKVVDAAGEPLVVYHGTPGAFNGKPIAEFSRKAQGGLGGAIGFWFADNVDVAKSFGRQRYAGVTPELIDVYLSIERPKEYITYQAFVDDANSMRGDTIEKRLKALRRSLEKAGHDGIVVRDSNTDGGIVRDDWVAFNPTQIKSVNNRGTFDPNDPRILFQVSPDQARAIDMETKLPDDPLFSEAVGNTEGATLTDDGLLIDLVRFQKPEQEGSTSVRTGVFYLPVGSPNARHYKAGGQAGQWYGGPKKVQGQTLVRRPLFVKGATGGKAPEAAYDAIKGKGAFKALQADVMRTSTARGALGKDQDLFVEVVDEFLNRNGADGSMAWEVIENSKVGNQLRYALQENVIAHAVREAGFDSVIGYSKGKKGASISEVFDVREVDYPTPGEQATLHPDFDRRTYRQGKRGAIELGDTSVITLFETADASTALHETGHMFLSMLKGMGEAADAPLAIKADWESVREWWRTNAKAVATDANASGRAKGITAANVIDALDIGTTGDAAKDRAIDVGMQEQWARAFEAYARDGKAPSAGLRRAFDQFKEWLTAIYRRAADLNVNLSPEIRQVFDNLLAEPTPAPQRGVPMIDGMPVRIGPAAETSRASPDVARIQASLLDNEPSNAAARVGKDDSIRDIALSHGVDPNTGDYVEMSDIQQLREQGLLTREDEKDLAAADQTFADAEAYGRALDAALGAVCSR